MYCTIHGFGIRVWGHRVPQCWKVYWVATFHAFRVDFGIELGVHGL